MSNNLDSQDSQFNQGHSLGNDRPKVDEVVLVAAPPAACSSSNSKSNISRRLYPIANGPYKVLELLGDAVILDTIGKANRRRLILLPEGANTLEFDDDNRAQDDGLSNREDDDAE